MRLGCRDLPIIIMMAFGGLANCEHHVSLQNQQICVRFFFNYACIMGGKPVKRLFEFSMLRLHSLTSISTGF